MPNLSNPALMLTPASMRSKFTEFVLQLGHRFAVVSCFAFLGGLAVLYKAGNPMWPLAAAMACADVACCSAVWASSSPSHRREARGLLLFGGFLVVLSLQLILLTRLELIRAAAAAFFTPS